MAFASYGHEVPPRTAELLMLQAAREDHEENVRMNESRPKSERVDLWQWSSPSSWTFHGIGDDGNGGDNDEVRTRSNVDQNMPAHSRVSVRPAPPRILA